MPSLFKDICHNTYPESNMKKVEHIGIAVKDLEGANDLFSRLFGKENYKIETVESEGVSTSFFRMGDTKIELLEATNQDSAIAKYLDKRGEGMHHIAFEVEDIHSEMKRLRSEGFTVLNEKPKRGADNKLVCFLHPKSTNGVLVELCQ
jgi:methylmalonyl-CoA/ethylmalonyl-CoA epimerase